MKFGLLDFDLTVDAYWNDSWNQKALLNVGDAAEYLAVEQIYRSMGIDSSQIFRISIPELTSYRGESLIVALNIALDSYVGYNMILERLSPDIIPVFLGMSFTSADLSPQQIECLKRYAPIGCRDERSYLRMQSLGIPCYLNGCVASVLQIKAREIPKLHNKILMIDVPYGVLQHIPQELKEDIVFLNQEIYCKKSEMPQNFLPSDWAKGVMAYYGSKPRMVVTSRFHGAVLALANDIPAVITLEKYTFRFSWLRNYCPIYTEETFRQIQWNPASVDYGSVRSLMNEVAEQRIREVAGHYQKLLTLTDLQRSTVSEEAESSNQVLYYQRVWKEIQKTWDPQKEYSYGFWGVNENTRALLSLIRENYPKARLTDIYDMFKTVSYEGLVSKAPRELGRYRNQQDYYVIVTAYLASRVVPDICDECGFPMERSFRCERNFILPEDLMKAPVVAEEIS
ncbi:polysaccharide pyruvyl transferase family protein [Yanshouia hominis]|uniref:Polysaccharide pyruvyl transferase family protein n=1 Tax=Yanshouia hominis TaxID=2763673 RepID=A0ABR7NM54_9FIRM|nr:polysaccharide pyruvyl transferase family protein [Yanshouia hominis]MBC8577487.1 polysaccharide pyruvyl transferase family protein [Yanshouia hominis]